MTREDLITRTAELQATLEANKAAQTQLNLELNEITKKLVNMNKPVISQEQFDLIYEAIEAAIDNLDFSDIENYQYDFGMDYDGRVYIENIDFDNRTDLVSTIVYEVESLFNITKPVSDE